MSATDRTHEPDGGRRWAGALVGVVAVACCLAAPAIGGLLGGAALWGAGIPAMAAAVVLAGACFSIVRVARRRGRGRAC